MPPDRQYNQIKALEIHHDLGLVVPLLLVIALRTMQSTLCRKETIRLQTFTPSPGYEPRLNGAAASVTNHNTRWEAVLKCRGSDAR
ncbi:hypothetical protein TNCV_4844451 [Trichonephila clavipes]|uniref:Uncharacterized protein n=1 Tax=Trichonephila clavipes TaxID=2585209 RepID=A0A8X6WJ52_TRICX|nr:hypothetical protein TNCV_4844451 [Trichonephila clavipes]